MRLRQGRPRPPLLKRPHLLNPRRRRRACRVRRWRRKPRSLRHRLSQRSLLDVLSGATPIVIGDMALIGPPIGSRFRSTGRTSTAAGSTGTGYPGSASDAGIKPFALERPQPRDPPQIQFWKIISQLNVSIDVPTNAAEIGSIAVKPANAIATKAHNSQRGLLPRLSTYTSARLAIVADGK